MQFTLDQEGEPRSPYRRQARFLEYDISKPKNTKYINEYVVTLPLYTDPIQKNVSKATKVATQSKIH